MNFNLLTIFAADSGTDSGSTTSSTSDKALESIKEAFKGPVPYIIIGAIVLLVIAIYIIRRFIKARPNAVLVVVRHGKIHKLIDEKNPKYFLVPFTDSVGASISLNEQAFSSDKLFINNGPDALYKINFTLTYQVEDIEKYYKNINNFQSLANTKINDELREYADSGKALDIVKDYREHNEDILRLLNKALEDFGVRVNSFKVNFIEPLGKK